MYDRITLIANFDEKSNKQIEEKINKLGKNKQLCKVPYRKNIKDRYKVDTLPFHFTIYSWDIKEEKNIITKLKQIKFPKTKIKITGLNIKDGKENSYCLYFEIENNEEIKKLQKDINIISPNIKYNPENFIFHITIHIDKDYQKIINIKNILENNFKNIEITIENFGLYEIYPAKLIQTF